VTENTSITSLAKDFIVWYEKREELPTDKLHDFYIKFKFLLEEEAKANEAIRKFLG